MSKTERLSLSIVKFAADFRLLFALFLVAGGTLVSAYFNYTLGNWIGDSTFWGLSILGCLYASLDLAFVYVGCMVFRVSGILRLVTGIWSIVLLSLSVWACATYVIASDAKNSPTQSRIHQLERSIEDANQSISTWTDKLSRTTTHTTRWSNQRAEEVGRLETYETELTTLRAELPSPATAIFAKFGIEESQFIVRTVFGIAFVLSIGLCTYLLGKDVNSTSIKPTNPNRTEPKSDRTEPKPRGTKAKKKVQTKSKPKLTLVKTGKAEVKNAISKGMKPTVGNVKKMVGSTDKAAQMLRDLLKEGFLVKPGRDYKLNMKEERVAV